MIQELIILSRELDDLTSRGKGLSKEKKLRLEGLLNQINNTIEGVRRLSQDLRPATLDRLGLLSALEWLISDMRKYSGIALDIKVHGAERRFPAELELMLFRITQEALANIWRHSEASKAEVVLEFNKDVIKRIIQYKLKNIYERCLPLPKKRAIQNNAAVK